MSNNLVVEVYQGYSTTNRGDSIFMLRDAGQRLTFSTFFPGGLHGDAEIYIPLDVAGYVPWVLGDRVVIRNGRNVCWEGELVNLNYSVSSGTDQGIILSCLGYWGSLLGNTYIDRRWADNRMSEEVWVADNTGAGADLVTYDFREQSAGVGRIKIVPKAESWGNGDKFWFAYTMPDGETVGRVKGNYRFAEGAQSWQMRVIDDSLTTAFLNISATGTGTFDTDDATPEQTIRFELISGAAQTPTNADGSTYKANINGVFVYAQPSTDFSPVTLSEIVKDIRAYVSNLNSDESNVDVAANEFTLEPFYTVGPERISDVLTRAAQYGDDDDNQWYVRLIDSESASSPDGKPVIESKQYPALTAFDYAVRLDEENLLPPLDIARDVGSLANYIYVRYRHPDGKRDIIQTPNDDATLKDTTSITAWGQREYLHDAGPLNTGGQKILAARKDPQIYIASPITVVGYIRGANGEQIPASQIQAGKRVKIENFLEDLAGTSGAGLTAIITRTIYDDASETCQIYTGVPDDLSVFMAQLNLRFG